MEYVTLINEEAKEILFRCPGCKSHHAIHYGPGGWTWNGDRVKPTFQPSVLSNANRECPDLPRCHSFVTDGNIQFLSDCTHELAGQTVPIPLW